MPIKTTFPQGPVGDASSSTTPTPVARSGEFASRHEYQILHDSLGPALAGGAADGAQDIPAMTNPTSPSEALTTSPTVPRLSRAYSTPLPQQIAHWQRPRRLQSSLSYISSPAPTDRHFQDLALELADSVQQTVQTLFQLSPPHIFDPAKEQFSPCAVQIPTPSLSALLTSMKHLNYISANMQTLGTPYADTSSSEPEEIVKDEFDIGEVLQSVGDSFSGLASDAEVDVVLHHGDAIQHMGVKGDECGISYALTHVIHQVLATAQSGDSLEIGLSISSSPNNEPDPSFTPSTAPESSSSVNDFLTCTFDIAHKFSPSEVALSDGALSPEEKAGLSVEPGNENEESSLPPLSLKNAQTRSEPSFDSIILRRLLSRVDGVLRTETVGGPDNAPIQGRKCQLILHLERGPSLSVLHQRNSPVEDDHDSTASDVPLAREPSLEELMVFAESLKGKEAAFHASSKSAFAHYLTRYLVSWGVAIAHLPTDVAEEQDFWDDSLDEGIPTLSTQHAPARNLAVNNKTENPISMIIIDDDVHALRRRLLKHRAETSPSIPGRNRPSLAPNHRTKSSPSIRNVLLAAGVQAPAPSPAPVPFTPAPIIHFTSLARYKLVKDVIQGVIFTPGAAPLLPEVIVIPKPAGPRRILAALHTAMTKPVVDPFFSPIATSPMSPGLVTPMSAHTSSSSSRSKQSGTGMPGSSRNNSGRAMRSNSESLTVSSSSPLSQQETFEYFSEEAVQLGDSPASGVVIHSPDGRPRILFQPQSRTGSLRSDSPATDYNALRPPSRRSGKSVSRRDVSSPESVPRAVSGGRAKSTSDPRSSHYPQGISPISPLGEPLFRPTEYGRKIPAELDSSTQEQLRAVASMSWQEATKHLAMTPVATPGGDEMIEPVINSVPPVEPPPSVRSDSGSTTKTVRTSGSSSPEHKLKLPTQPLLPKPATMSKGKKTSTSSNGIVPPINVLIVEDNPINQTHYTTVLRRNSIKYEVAWNGREAVEKWQKGNFHLILMDIQMPIMDGITATKEIRRLEKANEIGGFSPAASDSLRRPLSTPNSRTSATDTTPFRSQVIIVALTASSLQSDRVAALAAGCNDFLTKPVDNDWLIDKVIEWGSIKALQMWAELRPQIAGAIDHDQAVQAQTVAERLHVPPKATRNSPERPTEPLPDVEERSPMEPRSSVSDLQSTDERQEDLGDENSDAASEQALELPQQQSLRNDPIHVSGETALLRYIEESQNMPQATEGFVSGAPSTMSIAAVLYDTPNVGENPGTEPSGDSNEPVARYDPKDP